MRDSSLPSSLPYPSRHLSHHPSLGVSFKIRQPKEGEVVTKMNCDQIITIIQHDYPSLQNTIGNKVRLGKIIKALGFNHKEHSHVTYYEVVPLHAA